MPPMPCRSRRPNRAPQSCRPDVASSRSHQHARRSRRKRLSPSWSSASGAPRRRSSARELPPATCRLIPAPTSHSQPPPCVHLRSVGGVPTYRRMLGVAVVICLRGRTRIDMHLVDAQFGRQLHQLHGAAFGHQPAGARRLERLWLSAERPPKRSETAALTGQPARSWQADTLPLGVAMGT